MNQKYEDAAELVADDRLNDEQIAQQCGIHRSTLKRLKQKPEFQARVSEINDAFAAAVLKRGIARKEHRVAALHDRWRRMQQVIEERATDPDLQKVPGGKTGLLVRQLKKIGNSFDAETVEEFAVDTGLLKELRAHEKQAAEELGQWTEKHEHSGEITMRTYRGVPVDEV